MNTNKYFRKMNSFRSRYFLLFSALSVIVIVLSVLQFVLMDDFFVIIAKRDLITASKSVMELDDESDTFVKDIIELEADYNIYIELYKPRDELIYTTGDNNWLFNPVDSTINRNELNPKIMKILEHKDIDNHSFFEIRQEYYGNAKHLVYSITDGNKTSELYYPVEIINNNADTTSWALLTVTIILYILMITFTLAYLHSFIIPLDEINAVTKNMTKMDFNSSCQHYSIKELDELSRNINALSDSLNITLENLRNKNQQLQKEIEKEHTLTETRKDFIASASHELKTPIAIIQGYAEGLKYGIADGKADEYYDIIIDETEKMNTLVLRLLEQTKYDYGGYKVKYTTFNILEAVNKLMHTRIRILEDKDINTIYEIDNNLYTYYDENIFNIVLGNYISNAISHCENEKYIKIICCEKGDVYRISVINSGAPINEEDIENIWNSFYRADKAHSRNSGRFGLGLSIVASLQNNTAHKYGVINHKNSVEFWFDIPKFYNKA